MLTSVFPVTRRDVFAIGVLFIVVALVLVGGYFRSIRVEQSHRQGVAVAMLRQVGATVGYDYEVNREFASDPIELPGPEWQRNKYGINFVADVKSVQFTAAAHGHPNFRFREAELSCLKELRGLEDLSFYGTPLEDSHLHYLFDLKQLKALSVTNTNVTEEGIKLLRKKLPRTKILD